MKILKIHNEYFFKGGEDSVVNDEKEILIKNNCTVSQLIRRNKFEIRDIFNKIKVAKNLSFSMNSKEIVENKIINFKPDIVHIHNTFPLWTYSIIDACNNMRIPVVMSLHNFRLICAKGVFYRNNQICETCINSSPYNAIKNACYQNSAIKSIPVAMMIKKYNKGLALINKINKFIVPTKFSKNQFTKIGFNKNKIVIKPNFIINDLSSYISKNKNGFVYASRLSLDKGLYDLIDVYNELNFNLTVCGNGPLKEKIKKIKSINFLGYLKKNNLYKVIGKSQFLVFPSKTFETFGNIILEAFALETVVIAPILGSIPYIIKDKHNGILYKANDKNDLMSKIKWALSNPNQCETIKKNAKKTLKKKYTEDINYKILINIYEEAIKENKNNKLSN